MKIAILGEQEIFRATGHEQARSGISTLQTYLCQVFRVFVTAQHLARIAKGMPVILV